MNHHQKEEIPPAILNILLAEDDPDDQELIREAFKEINTNLSLFVVEDGNSVLSYLDKVDNDHLPSLIILDYNMPDLNGAQVLRRLSESSRYDAIPKVVLSTSSNLKYIKETEATGANAYRTKPYDFMSLVAIVREMLALCKVA